MFVVNLRRQEVAAPQHLSRPVAAAHPAQALEPAIAMAGRLADDVSEVAKVASSYLVNHVVLRDTWTLSDS
jgi:hypothetical protein